MSGIMRRLLDILEMPLTEQAFQRKEILSEARSISRKLNQHLYFLLVFGVVPPRNHWVSECCAWIGGIAGDYTKNGKYLSEKDYYNSLFGGLYDPLEFGVRRIPILKGIARANYPDFPMKDVSDSDILAQMRSFHIELAANLSLGGVGADNIIRQL